MRPRPRARTGENPTPGSLPGAFRFSPSSLSGNPGPGPANAHGLSHIRIRPGAPRFWRNIAPALAASPLPANQGDAPQRSLLVPAFEDDRFFYWRLVLSAKRIPYRHFARAERGKSGDGAPLPMLFVPPVSEGTALAEITAFEQERPAPPLPHPPDKGGVVWVALFFACLFAWHYLRWNLPGLLHHADGSPFSSAADWLRAGGLDVYRTRTMGEWYRTVTALTLHADAAHVLGNIVLGAVFMVPLCRRVGPGLCLFLTVLAGGLGNAATLYFRPAASVSLGFSTSLFGAVGLLAAFMAVHAFTHRMSQAAGGGMSRVNLDRPMSKKVYSLLSARALKNAAFQAMLPLGAGLGVLAMLGGSDAPGVSYLSHVMGLFAGVALGLPAALYAAPLIRLAGGKAAAVQGAALLLTALTVFFAWRAG